MFSLSDSIQISSFNTPLDVRTRVADLSKLTDGSIQMPYVGLIVWVTNEEKAYVVTGITGTLITSYEILNSEDYFNYTSSTTYTDLSNNTKPVRKDGYVVEVDHDTSTSPYKYILQYIDGLGIHHKITVSQSGGANTDITNTIAEVYVYNGNYQGLYQAVQEGKVIIWNNNVATVEYLNNAFRLSVIDGDGVLHTLIISAGNLQLPTEDTKHFLKKEDYLYFGNDTTFLELKNRGQIPVKVDEHVAKVTDLGTSIKMEYLDGPVLTTVIKSSDESVSRSTVNILLSVEVDPSDNSFDIKNALGTSVGSINFGSNSTTGIAELTFTDGTNTFSAPLPSIRYDSNTQLLKYTTDGGETWQDIIKMSNLLIKEVAASTSALQLTPTLGDLVLIGDNTNGYELNVFDGTNWQSLGSISNVSLVADQVSLTSTKLDATNVKGGLEELHDKIENIQATVWSGYKVSFDNSQSGLNATDVQRAIEEVNGKFEDIEREHTVDIDDSIEIEDEQGNKVVEITPNGVDAKNLKSNGYNVLTEDDIDLDDLATKDDLEDKQDVIEGIEQEQMAIQSPNIEFRDDEDNYVGDISPQGIAAKKILIKTSASDEGTDILQTVGNLSIAKQFGMSDIIHVIGYGQSLMAGSFSGDVVTTTQSRNNLFRFDGGVRPYDVFDLDIYGRVAIKRQSGVNPTYLEMSDNKIDCLESSDVALIESSIGSLIPLVEQRVKYTRNQDDTYTPSTNGTINDKRHADGETALSGFCEGFLNALERWHGSNFGFDVIATCCAYGSADFPSLLPFDREGRTHNPTVSDGSNMNYFEVLLMSVKAAKALADAANKTYSVDVAVYMESSTQMPNVSIAITNPMRAYRIAQLFTLINQRVKAITKQSNDIIFLCDQSKTYTEQREALRILAVEKEFNLTTEQKDALDTLNGCYIEPYDFNKIYLVTSANNYPVRKGYDPNDTGGDRIHHPSKVQKQKGATLGEAYAKIVAGKGFKPLYPIDVKVIGNDIYIKYNVPVSPIVIDENAINGNQNYPTYMSGYGKYGFGITDGTNYLDIINTVNVVEPDTIKISCSASLSGKILEYCYDSMANSTTGTTGPTNSEFGNIRDSQGDEIKISIDGTDFPLHNWSIGFRKALS